MKDYDPVERFVTDMLEFIPDMDFTVLSVADTNENSVALAAAGGQSISIDAGKIGVLTSTNEKILVRVFIDRKNEQYNLFIISDTNQPLENAILYSAESFKYFVVYPTGRVNIPFASDVNPISDSLAISFPRVRVTVGYDDLMSKRKGSLACNDGSCHYSLSESEDGSFKLQMDQVDFQGTRLTKVLVIIEGESNNDRTIRLSPLHGDAAEVAIPYVPTGKLKISFYL